MGNIGTTELILIILVILVFFGSKKIPELAQGLGKGIREFKKATREIQEDDADPRKIDQKPVEEKKG
jgi:sec-independent protein translocase protein TatA